MIRTLRRVSGVLPLTRGLTDASAVVVFIAFSIRLASVNNAVHTAVVFAVTHLLVNAEAGPTACTATLALVVSGECIATCKPAATLEAGVRTFTSV
jgi:hypothetical protein